MKTFHNIPSTAFGIFLITGIVSLLAHVVNAQTPCSTYSSGSTPPQAFGTAWNALSSAKELLLDSNCQTSSVTFKAGTGSNTQYVFKQGYYYTTSWQPFTLTGTPAQGSTDWLVGQGTYTLNNLPRNTLYWAAYICQLDSRTNGIRPVWKCGCRDSTCAQSLWQLQGARLPVSPQPPTNAAAAKCPGATARADQCPAGCVYYGVPLGCITQEYHDYCSRTGACPECLARGTLISTPNGAIAVEAIVPGTLVWTHDGKGNRIAAPVLRVAKTPVPRSTHQVVALTLGDGRTAHVSPGHPTADGRTFGALKAGDTVDGAVVHSAALIPYIDAFTYDILPDSSTGEYWANGILFGSTLKQASHIRRSKGFVALTAVGENLPRSAERIRRRYRRVC